MTRPHRSVLGCTVGQNQVVLRHLMIHSERINEHYGARVRSEQCRLSKFVGGASK